ncbi:MAG: tRNA pseudouridine(38-40) synthase TruA [Planctomycetota bacterium]|jgi:tRNA pseudouridine38-40 synthase|nr:tRNA pseudouridine(38-40) synthase TruA [Planctomycetota bacterium]
MPRKFAITVAYDGTDFGGWQLQINAITIQQRLTEAIAKATTEHTHVNGSGRTDSGVHAQGQVAAFVLQNWKHDSSKLALAINRYLPESIVVRHCREVVLPFDPIRDARSKRYRYTIRNSKVSDVMNHRFHWWLPKKLDHDAMRAAAKFLVGTHDFKGFETPGSPRLTTTRTVYALEVTTVPTMDGVDIWIDVEADGFLYNMVRNIVGTLRDVGADRFGPRWMLSALESRERKQTDLTAPARGLCLMQVNYLESLFLDSTSQ